MSNTDNPRNTQFAGFAKLLWKELEDHPYVELGQLQDCDREQLYRVIAQRAYDLACDVVSQLDSDVMWRIGKGHAASEIVENDVADMTKWPDEVSP